MAGWGWGRFGGGFICWVGGLEADGVCAILGNRSMIGAICRGSSIIIFGRGICWGRGGRIVVVGWGRG